MTTEICETAANQDPVIGLKRNAVHRPARTRIERGVQGSIRLEAADIGPGLATQLREAPADNYFSITLQRER